MDIPKDQQLEAFTGFRVRDLCASNGVELNEDGFTVAGRSETLENGMIVAVDIRSLFSFSREELIAYLRAHPERLDGYFEHWRTTKDRYDMNVVEPADDGFVLYWQDRERRRDEHFYADIFEAAADWLCTQYGMWLFSKAA